MPLSLDLDEEDLTSMPSELRDGLLKWYFGNRRPPKTAAPAAIIPAGDNESRRVTFAKFLDAKLLEPGDEIYCRTLKRQQRGGKPKYLKGAHVSAAGVAEFNGQEFSHPSNLAVAMVAHSGEKPTSLNGFDYLFAHAGKTLVPLKKLRDRLAGGGADRMKRRFLAEGAVQDAKRFGLKTTVEDHEPFLKKRGF
jgi:hypothetical protein